MSECGHGNAGPSPDLSYAEARMDQMRHNMIYECPDCGEEVLVVLDLL
jgi:predicted RNA-binding Zn-ribbon protein involved in translation (DUF1610 family)